MAPTIQYDKKVI